MKYLLEHTTCDLCGSDKYKIRYLKPDTWLQNSMYQFSVVECNQCGLVYLNPRPTQESMGNFYPTEYHFNRNTEEWLYRYSVELSFLPQLTTETILDIGCARGEFLNYLIGKYPNVNAIGIDYYSTNIDSNKFCFIQKLLPDCNFGNNTFDIITAWGVFEHLHTPSAYFEEVARILKPNGKFVFLITNSESLYGKKAYIEDIPRHTYHFSENILSKYAEKVGLKFTNCHFDDRIWDGRGIGTYYYSLMKFVGWSWEKQLLGKQNNIHKLFGKLGKYIDNNVFRNHWEAKKRKSGIIIAEFTK